MEGSLAGLLITSLTVWGLTCLGITTVASWAGLLASLTITALAEAVCDQVDNLVLPLVLYCSLLLTQAATAT